MNLKLGNAAPGARPLMLALLAILALTRAPVSVGTNLTQTQDTLATTAAALIVEVDGRGGLRLNESPVGGVADTAKLTSRLKQIFEGRLRNRVYADRDGASQTDIPLNERIAKGVAVHPDTSLPYSDLLRLLSDLRAAGASPLNVELTVGDISFQATVPTPARSLTEVVPNPYFLLATMGADQSFELNHERVPSVEALTGRLVSIFEQRQKDGAFTPGGRQISRTVGLRVDPRQSVSALRDLLGAVGLAGASPVILVIDDPAFPTPAAADSPRTGTKPGRKQTRRP